jgi:arylsulfatase A-like enzyme
MVNQRVGAGTLLRYAVGFALLTGLIQNAARVTALVLGRHWDHGIHAWWMTPLGDFMLLASLVLLVLLVGVAVPFIRRAGVVFPVILFPVVLTPLMLVPRIHPGAKVILAAGIATVAGRALAARWARGDRFAHVGWFFLAVSVTTSVGVLGWSAVVERRAARSDVTPPPGAPNVLILLWDTVRASSLSLHGYRLPTTVHLDSFARSGVVFDRAIATASYTLPSHASIFTGRQAHELTANWRTPLDGTVPTLAETLKAAGYRTAAFSANRTYVTRGWGLGRGFDVFDEHRLGVQQVLRSSTLVRLIVTSEPVRRLLGFDDDLARVHAPDNARALLRWLARGNDARPYFAFVNFMDAHGPYLPPAPYDSIYSTADSTDQRLLRRLARQEMDNLPVPQAMRLQASYDGAIAGLDAAVGRLLAEMDQRGLLRNTVVVVTSDHGEEWGEHGVFGHGNSLYYRSINVPLVMVYPDRIPAGERVSGIVSLRDIPATLLDLAGLAPALPGRSLRSLWENPGQPDSAVAFSFIGGDPRLPRFARSRNGDLWSVVDSANQVIRNPDGSLEAFDVTAGSQGDSALKSLTENAEALARRLGSVRR